jgi:hypothetical protein
MVRTLITWAVFSSALWSVGATHALADTHPIREWTDAGGTKRAAASFVRFEGGWIILRRPNGEIAATNLANLSEADQQYVATLRRMSQPAPNRQSATASTSPTIDPDPNDAVERIAEGVTDAVESMQELPRWLGESQAADSEAGGSVVPAALVYVRVSREFLEDYVERSVQRRKPVRDCVLGTRIVGSSETRGKTRLTLLPSNDRLLASLIFEGAVIAHTRAYNGPVILHNTSDSTFTARRLIELSDSTLLISRATVVAPTQLTTHSITTHLPGIRGRIATRVAWRRTRSKHGRAEAITADRTADDIRRDFEERTNASLANVKRVFAETIPDLDEGSRAMPTDLRFRCRPEHLEMAILREGATSEERQLRPPPARAGSDVSLRVHRSLFTRAIADPQLLQDLTPLFEKLLQAQAKQKTSESVSSSATTTAAQRPVPNWSMDSGWLIMDFGE